MQPCFKKEKNTTQFLVDGRPFLIFGGELHNSSSSSLGYMEPIWEKLNALGLNTALMSVTWELLEPREGFFDFPLLDGLIDAARKHGLKLVLLWFATWKNAASSYVPEWVKTDIERFPRAIKADGSKTPAISCFSEECRKLDSRAFARMMAHIRKVDTDYTVIAVQVENETGLLDTARDYLPEANKLFEASLPPEFSNYLAENFDGLSPDLVKHMDFSNLNGTWRQAFGSLAEEAFMAYYTAKYVGSVAKAGKEEYNLPMFANAWTAQSKNEPAGFHPSGGPTAQMHDIWRYAAPELDALAPDLYLECFDEECAAYTRLKDNPLIIPEARPDKWMLAHAFYAFGEHDALCFSPFKVEEIGNFEPASKNLVAQSVFQTMSDDDTSGVLRDTYGVLGNLSPIICKYRGTGRMRGILQTRCMDKVLEFTDYYAHIRFNNYVDRVQVPAGGLVIELDVNDFLFAGAGFSVQFVPKPDKPRNVEYLSLDEGRFKDDEWVRDRRLNGDEMYLPFPSRPVIRRYRIFCYS